MTEGIDDTGCHGHTEGGCPEALLSLQAWRRRPWNFSHHSFEVEIASHLSQWVDSHRILYPIVSEHCKHLPPAPAPPCST